MQILLDHRMKTLETQMSQNLHLAQLQQAQIMTQLQVQQLSLQQSMWQNYLAVRSPQYIQTPMFSYPPRPLVPNHRQYQFPQHMSAFPQMQTQHQQFTSFPPAYPQSGQIPTQHQPSYKHPGSGRSQTHNATSKHRQDHLRRNVSHPKHDHSTRNASSGNTQQSSMHGTNHHTVGEPPKDHIIYSAHKGQTTPSTNHDQVDTLSINKRHHAQSQDDNMKINEQSKLKDPENEAHNSERIIVEKEPSSNCFLEIPTSGRKPPEKILEDELKITRD